MRLANERLENELNKQERMDDSPILTLPENDIDQPELSIVIPALNEEKTIGEFMQWCKEGIEKAQVLTEILIVDSSTDRTAEIAQAMGARVLKVPKRGLGQAYIDAIPYIRGKFVLLGDCDCTYDFREISDFIAKFRAGYEFIMGSRFLGYIEPDAMPFSHQYFGTPVTTWILNFIYKSNFSDIHCGMRGISKDAFLKINLQSKGWEYASEMVLKSVHWRLKTTEVPIRFLRDRNGRVSHHKRMGWLSPWLAGWDNLKAMLIFGADFFLTKPGAILFFIGSLFVMSLSTGPYTVGIVTFSLYWMLLGVCIATIGINSFYAGLAAKVIFDYRGKISQKIDRMLPYTPIMFLAMFGSLIGFILCVPLWLAYTKGLLPDISHTIYFNAVFGLFILIVSFASFSFMLLIKALMIHLGRLNN